MKKYGFVYIWFDRKRKMYYIGSHWGTQDDGYICSSNRMRNAYRRRPEDFTRKILETTDYRSELLNIEQKWLTLAESKSKEKYYNMCFVTYDKLWWNDENRIKTVGEKISASRTGKKYSPRGPRSEETKQKISEALTGRKLSKSTIEKRSKTNTGKRRKPYKSYKQTIVICSKCKKQGGASGMKRYHFDNCEANSVI